MIQSRRARFAIAEMMGVVAAVAVACVWPVMTPLVISGVLTWLLHYRMGLSLLMTLVVITTLALGTGLLVVSTMRPVFQR